MPRPQLRQPTIIRSRQDYIVPITGPASHNLGTLTRYVVDYSVILDEDQLHAMVVRAANSKTKRAKAGAIQVRIYNRSTA